MWNRIKRLFSIRHFASTVVDVVLYLLLFELVRVLVVTYLV
jgi:hypothetical protein